MAELADGDAVTYDVLKRYGGKWAVLMSMAVAMSRSGIELPSDVNEKLKTARLKIASGCFSTCEVSCALAEIESRLSYHFHLLDDQEFEDWYNLLGEAMQGHLDYQRIMATSALEPVKNDCGFLDCHC